MSSLRLRRPDLAGLPPLPTGVELATADDDLGLARLLDASFDSDWTGERVRRELLAEPTVLDTYLIRSGDRIVATASARALPDRFPAGWVHWVASDPVLRGRGLGLSVVLAVLHRFADDGLTTAAVETDDHRLPAISAYLRLGFVPQYPTPRHHQRWSQIFRHLSLRRHSR